MPFWSILRPSMYTSPPPWTPGRRLLTPLPNPTPHSTNNQGPRLKMMNMLSKAAGGMNSGSVGGGSNAGSVAAPSPEARHSPQPSLSSQSSFPVGNMASLGMSASSPAAGAAGAAAAVSGGRPPVTPERRSPDEDKRSADGSGTVTVTAAASAVGDLPSAASRFDEFDAAGAGAVAGGLGVAVDGEEDGSAAEDSRGGGGGGGGGGKGVAGDVPAVVDGGAGLGLPPRWDSGVTAERSLSPASDVWVSSALATAEGAGEGGGGAVSP